MLFVDNLGTMITYGKFLPLTEILRGDRATRVSLPPSPSPPRPAYLNRLVYSRLSIRYNGNATMVVIEGRETEKDIYVERERERERETRSRSR